MLRPLLSVGCSCPTEVVQHSQWVLQLPSTAAVAAACGPMTAPGTVTGVQWTLLGSIASCTYRALPAATAASIQYQGGGLPGQQPPPRHCVSPALLHAGSLATRQSHSLPPSTNRATAPCTVRAAQATATLIITYRHTLCTGRPATCLRLHHSDL